MAILSLFARLGLDKTGFDAGMKSAGNQVEQFGKDIKSQIAGAFTAAAATSFLRSIVDMITRVKDLSEQFGLTTEEVQNTDFALKQSGMQFDSLVSALSKLGSARREAFEGNEKLQASFQKYGLTLKDLDNPQLRNYDLLLKMSEALKGVNIGAREQAELTEILGPRAFKLANILKDLASQKPPVIVSDEDVQRTDKLVKQWERIVLLAQTVGVKIASTVNPFEAGREMGAVDPTRSIMQKTAGGMFGSLFKQIFKGEDSGLHDAPTKDFDNLMQIVGSLFGAGTSGFGTFRKGSPGVSGGIDSDPFQRIGAFTGASATSAQENLLRDVRSEIQQMRRELQNKGILVRGTD